LMNARSTDQSPNPQNCYSRPEGLADSNPKHENPKNETQMKSIAL
jgi:hypothetical protein